MKEELIKLLDGMRVRKINLIKNKTEYKNEGRYQEAMYTDIKIDQFNIFIERLENIVLNHSE